MQWKTDHRYADKYLNNIVLEFLPGMPLALPFLFWSLDWIQNVIIVALAGFGLIAWILFLIYRGVGKITPFKCPDCSDSILKPTKGLHPTPLRVVFVCKKCDVCWDTGLEREG
jgi:hypothetical protein